MKTLSNDLLKICEVEIYSSLIIFEVDEWYTVQT